MKIQQLSSATIFNLLSNRINATNRLYNFLRPSFDVDLDVQKTLFFRYFFDFSTAIESLSRAIAFEEAGSSNNRKYVVYVGQIDESSKSFFLGQDEASPLFNDFSNFKSYVKKKEFDAFKNTIPCLQRYSRKFDVSQFALCSAYQEARKTRNILAHGLQEAGVDYTLDTLYNYALVFFALLKYYELIEKSAKNKKN